LYLIVGWVTVAQCFQSFGNFRMDQAQHLPVVSLGIPPTFRLGGFMDDAGQHPETTLKSILCVLLALKFKVLIAVFRD